jgi:hypothetical protein
VTCAPPLHLEARIATVNEIRIALRCAVENQVQAGTGGRRYCSKQCAVPCCAVPVCIDALMHCSQLGCGQSVLGMHQAGAMIELVLSGRSSQRVAMVRCVRCVCASVHWSLCVPRLPSSAFRVSLPALSLAPSLSREDMQSGESSRLGSHNPVQAARHMAADMLDGDGSPATVEYIRHGPRLIRILLQVRYSSAGNPLSHTDRPTPQPHSSR